jgi:trk system potassium uptake protein
MNYRVVSKILGLLLVLLSATMLLCLAYSYYIRHEPAEQSAVEAFWISVICTFMGGALLLLLGRKSGTLVMRKEAVVIVGLGWFLSGIFGAFPYLFSQPGLGLVDAMFESFSGFTTTGATVIRDLNPFPRSILLWRALSQWLGGLGILVLFVALLSYLGVGSKALFRHESSAKSGEGLQARIRDVAARLWQIYLALSMVCCLGLMGLGMSFYEALVHTFTAISTGGFSTENASIAAYESWGIELWLVLFMMLGGISFMFYAWLLRGKWERWRNEEETKAFLILLGLGIGVIGTDLFLLGHYGTVAEALRASVFQVVSICTTTGYATEDFEQWPPFSRIVLVLLMFIGGCAGSTSGGIKVSRWVLFFKIVRTELVGTFRPNRVMSLQLNGNQVDDVLKLQTIFFVALAGLTVGLGTAVVSLLEPKLDMVSSFAAVAACLFNIGPGLGAVGPTENYAALGSGTKIFLSWMMVLGRLEFFTVLVLFLPSLWRKY